MSSNLGTVAFPFRTKSPQVYTGSGGEKPRGRHPWKNAIPFE
jgi:hypothetical protein